MYAYRRVYNHSSHQLFELHVACNKSHLATQISHLALRVLQCKDSPWHHGTVSILLLFEMFCFIQSRKAPLVGFLRYLKCPCKVTRCLKSSAGFLDPASSIPASLYVSCTSGLFLPYHVLTLVVKSRWIASMTKFRHTSLSLSLSLCRYILYVCTYIYIYMYTATIHLCWLMYLIQNQRLLIVLKHNRRDLLIKKLVTHTSHPSMFVHLLLKESNGRLLEGHGVASLSNLFLPSHMGRCFVRKLQVTRSFPTQVLCVSGVSGQNPGGDQLGWWKYWSFGVSILTWKDSLMLVSYAVFNANGKLAPLVGSSSPRKKARQQPAFFSRSRKENSPPQRKTGKSKGVGDRALELDNFHVISRTPLDFQRFSLTWSEKDLTCCSDPPEDSTKW